MTQKKRTFLAYLFYVLTLTCIVFAIICNPYARCLTVIFMYVGFVMMFLGYSFAKNSWLLKYFVPKTKK